MSPLNRGSLLGPRLPPVGVRPPPPSHRFGGRILPPGLPQRMPLPPMNLLFGTPVPRPGPGSMMRPGGPPPLFPPRGRGMPPIPPMRLMGPGRRGPPMRPWPRGMPPQLLRHMRPMETFPMGNASIKGKKTNNPKKVNKLEKLDLKKPWMTDEIRSEIQKKNKLYAKAKKNKDSKEWEEFKGLRNRVTRMIREASNEYFTKHPEQAHLYADDIIKSQDQEDEDYISSEDDEGYHCDVCDKEFTSEDDFTQHNEIHKLCGIDGCTFSAHPLLVEKHIQMQHSSGLYERLKNLSTPEDIEKWISERKKKYPTKANIEFKKSEELEKQQRGEVIEQTCLKSHKKLRTVSKVVEKKRRGRKRNRNNYKEPIICESKRYRGLIGFTGTSNLPSLNDEENTDDINAESSNIIISDEEDIPKTNDHAIAEPLPLLTLVANYGSDSDEDEKPMEEPIMKVDSYSCKDNINEEINTDDKSNINSDLNENVKKILNISQDKSNSESNKKVQNRLTQPKMDMRNSNSSINNNQRNKPQLLQRLLARDIQHERNLIFQCIKYITDNNFFD